VVAESTSVSTSGPVILDNEFPDYDSGLPLPRTVLTTPGRFPVARSGANTLQIVAPLLQITNLDRRTPPGYRPGGVPRAPEFNSNVLAITATPAMPRIAVQCAVRGFSPAQTPIYWRLQCRHVLARHMNTGNGRYRGASEIHEDEWQGRSTSPNFVLFGTPPDPSVVYDYNSVNAIMGGHAILTVAVRAPGTGGWLSDYVHLRIGGTNPVRADVERYLANLLRGRDTNVVAMLRAILVHESGYKQFLPEVQTANRAYGLRFDWPNDPANFPLAAFDFGIGLSQYTKSPTQPIGRGVAWDWRENVRASTNLFLIHKLRATYRQGRTWREWAHIAWLRYNGSGARALNYANGLAASAEGQRVSAEAVPRSIDLEALTAYIRGSGDRPAPPAWPPR
jgi:hypothetical protein